MKKKSKEKIVNENWKYSKNVQKYYISSMDLHN